MTTREQKLRELVERWRDRVVSDDDYEYKEGFYAAQYKCADELAAILNEPVEVSDAMIDAAGNAIGYCIDEYMLHAAITAALKEAGEIMNQNNIISAAQARLNFCDPEYVNLYKEINNRITDDSRKHTSISVQTDANASVRTRVLSDLKELGYKVNYWHIKDKTYALGIEW